MSDKSRPAFSPARAMLVFADHDGDDRAGYLIGAMKDFVLAREDCTDETFPAKFDEIMNRVLGELIDEEERRNG